MKIIQPTLKIDTAKCKANIQRMVEKAQRNHVIFRPHFKSHQSHEIGLWFREYGVEKITVSSVSMAQYFADNGWNDITIAFPMNILEIERINKLAKNIHLNLLIESKKVLEFAEKNLKTQTGVFIKIDAGYHRTGIPIENHNAIDELIKRFSSMKKCIFKGFLVHNGHTYNASSTEKIIDIHVKTLQKLKLLKEKYLFSFPDLILSFGDTPTMSILENFENVDEIRPGNFVFYDLMQSQLNVCNEQDIAVAIACPIVAKHENRNQVVIYGGAVHFSKESISINNQQVFGKLVLMRNGKWIVPVKNYFLVCLSQEHGIIQLDQTMMYNICVGDLIGILPIHSCLTANLHQYYITETYQKIKKFYH